MKITAHGAATEVTGTKHLVEINGYRILLDCGMFQGKRSEADFKNRHWPFDPETIDVLILSHAHIDHSGVLPVLARRGFRGRIYCTSATRDLCSIMLLDSANIQERDSEWLSKKNQTFVAPLYDESDVREIMRHVVCIPYGEQFAIAPDVNVTLQDAGHVLGSAMVLIDFKENGQDRRLLFTGDLGRKNMPILKDPWQPDHADILLIEGTYGDRDHEPIQDMEAKLADIVQRAVNRGGKIIVPSFALERAQEVIYSLKTLELRKAIPELPVYVDSPLTVNITDIFRQHQECFDAPMNDLMKAAGDPFKLHNISYITKLEDSMRLNSLKGPAMIISAAGMCEHGRILHHLRNNCEDPKNIIMIVGFQAKNTLGRRIVERQKEIRIFGIPHPLNAEVRIMNGFSAHAGRTELIDFAKKFKNPKQHVLLVHGEQPALESFQTGLKAEGVSNVTIMQEDQTISL